MGVIDREKVVRAVETCFDSWIDKHRNMGLVLDGVEQMKRDTLELLKKQEPRVLALDEIQAMPCDTPICVEEYYGSLYMDIYNGIDADSTDFITGNVHMECSYWIREEYGNLYRFWTAKPTDEQRKAVKWGD